MIEADFAPANFVNNYPQGSLIFLDFQDASHTINFQISYADHAYLDPPLFPGPSVHHNVPSISAALELEILQGAAR